ncbi:MAG: hypothetical protein HWE26_17580 [Alteromonadaceae bacterium]|nr:hypothetical protein [Alteromonadaceae bacterium]
MQSKWKLRILNGRHNGAEILLLPGMTIGRDEQANDVVITDDFVAEHLVRIDVQDDLLKLMATNSVPIRLEGGNVLAEDAPTPHQQPIQIGALVVAIARHDEPWAQTIIHYHYDPKTFAQPERQNADGHDDKGDCNARSAKQHRFNHRLKVAFFASLSIGLLSAASWLFSEDLVDTQSNGMVVTETNTPATSRESASLAALIAEPEYANISLSYTGDNTVATLEGYVNTRQELQRLLGQIAKLDTEVNTNLFSNEQIRDSATLILAHLGLEAVAPPQMLANGVLHITIDNAQLQQWEKAQEVLLTDISGLAEVDLDYPAPPPAMTVLQDMTGGLSISHKLVFVDTDSEILIKANLTAQERQQLSNAVAGFSQRVGDKPTLRFQQTDSRPKAPTLTDFGIAAVRYGESPYVTHQNGKRYLPGARLPNGASLQKFSAGEVTVLSGADILTLQLTPDVKNLAEAVSQTSTSE